MYFEYSLQQTQINGSKYNLIYKTKSPGRGAPSETYTETLLTDLDCAISGVVANCLNDKWQSVKFERVSRFGFTYSSSNMPEQMPTNIEVKVDLGRDDRYQEASFALENSWSEKCLTQ